MAGTLANVNIAASITADYTNGSAGLSLLAGRVGLTPTPPTLTVGTLGSAGNVNIAHVAGYTVNTASPTSIDLTAVADPGGNTVAFARAQYLLIQNLSTTTGEDLTVGGGTNGLFAADPVVIPPGGWRQWAIPKGIVVDSTHKILKLAAAAGAAVPVNVAVVGCTA